MNRRKFLGSVASGTALSVFDWLGFFQRNGVPGTAKDLGIATAAAQATSEGPRFLINWFMEGGWDSYSMFGPAVTPNDAFGSSPRPINDQVYRPNIPLVNGLYPVKKTGNISHGHLANEGASLFGDTAVVASHVGSFGHSYGRLECHYGAYGIDKLGQRKADERTMMQAFCEVYGASYLSPNVHWHRWESDTEDSVNPGAGYVGTLGPTHAHTIYGLTPSEFRDRIVQISKSRGGGRDAAVHKFVDNLHRNFMKDKNGESARAFVAAVDGYRNLVTGGSLIDPTKLFTDTALKNDFLVQGDDEKASNIFVDGNPGESKRSPSANVQAMMTYELLTKGISAAFWIENRMVRGLDRHQGRGSVIGKGKYDQKSLIDKELWSPLKTLVTKLKNTQVASTGKSYFDHTTIVITSEMGRLMGYKGRASDLEDVSEHNKYHSVAFLGGNVRGNNQYGKVGGFENGFAPIPFDETTGALHPSYDPVTGQLLPGKQAGGTISNVGHVYATALDLCGIPKSKQTGRNRENPLPFIKK